MIKLFDIDEKYLHDLHPLNAVNKEVLNGEDFVELTLGSDVIINKKDRLIVYLEDEGTWKEFIVEGVDEERTEGLKEVYAENSLNETLYDFVEDTRGSNTTANIMLGRVLIKSRWEVGRVDNLGVNGLMVYRTSVKDAIQQICETWKGEIRTRITISGNKIVNRYVDLLQERGSYLGERFITGENVNSIKRTITEDPIYTALYGFGKGEEIEDEEGVSTGGFGRRINFSSINNGKMYVEDNAARLKWGRLNSDGTRSHLFGKVEFDDVEVISEVLALTTEKLQIMKEPNVIYEGDVVKASAKLGDTVLIKDNINVPNLSISARAYEIERDLLNSGNNKHILGNYRLDITDTIKNQNDFINGFRDKNGIWDRADIIGEDGLKTEYLDGVIDVVKNKLLATASGWYTDDMGNIVLDAKDGNSSMMLSGAGFMIANSKLANGNWNYRTFGTGNGFVADEIITGILKGGKVKFDLTNGTLLIGNSIEDYSLFFDGNNLNIRLGNGNTIEKEIEDGLSGFDGRLDEEIEGVVKRLESNQSAIEMVDDALRLKIDNSEFQDFADGTRQLIGEYQSDFEATARKWDLNFTSVIGNNLLKNSVGFADTKFWKTTGNIKTEQSDELEILGSGSAFLIPHGAEIEQDYLLEADKTYTFSFMYVMNYETTRANILIELSDIEGESVILNESVNFYTTVDEDYKLGSITFHSNSTNMRLRIKNVSGSVKATNILINEGEYKQIWSPYKGEVYTTNVLTDSEGVKVKNVDKQGRVIGYTEQTPTQFAGYYDDIEVFRASGEVFRTNETHTKTIKIGNIRMGTNGNKLNIGLDFGGDD